MLHRAMTALRRRFLPVTGPADARQSGAVPYAFHEGSIFFLLITSRRTGRWIFPKGAIIPGLTPQDSAAQEAFEEAGVRGAVEAVPIGAYTTLKVRGGRRSVVAVDMYPLHVETQLDDWPERSQRHRHWVALAEARRLLDDRGLVQIAEALSRRSPGYAASENTAVIRA